ncbi:calcium-binding protein [Ancylobacter lacus]|uniref:calcium-binding protein n=1 Tax=Ancylobacter lacus TaxID=2579970 RepID=UPI001BD18F9C|nr:calcium-binding protein [Ancylobacter lacus]MBS7541055.1 hypothetical protein [Ancylobacter lacus]
MQFVYQGKLNSRSTATLGTTSTTISIAGFYASSTVYTATATDKTLTGTANNDAFIYDFTLNGVNKLRFSGFSAFDLGAGDDFFDMTVRASNAGSPYSTPYSVSGGSGNDRLWLAGTIATAYGDVETMTGTSSAQARGGDDIIDASQVTQTNDWLIGDAFTLTYARGGDDLITGSAQDDVGIYGDGMYLLNSYGGNDTLAGGAGNDAIAGDASYLAGSSDATGDNTVAYGGNDILFGDEGADILIGDGYYLANSQSANAIGGSDTLHGGTGDDLLYGDGYSLASGLNSGADGGNDTLYGDDGADTIYGDAQSIGGNDPSSIGQLGYDIIDGGAGNDQLWGDYGSKSSSVSLAVGGGNDQFVFEPGSDHDTINDFGQQLGGPQGRDTIDLAAYGIHAFGDLDISGNGTAAPVIDLHGGNTITVKAFDGSALTLTSADFTFA